MSRIAMLVWLCDLCEEAESPVASNWRDVRKLALAEGWFEGEKDDDDEHPHLCPKCQAT